MRTTRWIGGITMAAAVGGLLTVATVPAEAKSQKIKEITCEEFLALVEDCKATPKETLWQKLKKHL